MWCEGYSYGCEHTPTVKKICGCEVRIGRDVRVVGESVRARMGVDVRLESSG